MSELFPRCLCHKHSMNHAGESDVHFSNSVILCLHEAQAQCKDSVISNLNNSQTLDLTFNLQTCHPIGGLVLDMSACQAHRHADKP